MKLITYTVRPSCLVALIVCVARITRCLSEQKEIFREMVSARGRISMVFAITEEKLDIRADCAAFCSVQKSCQSFFHDNNGGLCRLMARHLKNTQMTTSTSTTISYYKTMQELQGTQDEGSSSYMGCYRDVSGARALPERHNLHVTNSMTVCVALCRKAGHNYAGLQFKIECWCGENYAKHGARFESECQLYSCPGNTAEKCGGFYANAIYSTDP